MAAATTASGTVETSTSTSMTMTTGTTVADMPETITIISDCLPRCLYSHTASSPNYFGEDFVVLDACNESSCTDGEDESKNLANESRNTAEEEKTLQEQILEDELEGLGQTTDENSVSWLPHDELDSFFSEEFKDSTVEVCGTESSPQSESLLPLETTIYPTRPFQSVVASVLRNALCVHERPPSLETEERPSKKFKPFSDGHKEVLSVTKPPLYSTPSSGGQTQASNVLREHKSVRVTSPCGTIEFPPEKDPSKAGAGTSAVGVPVRSSTPGHYEFDSGYFSPAVSTTADYYSSISSSSSYTSSRPTSSSSYSSTISAESRLNGRSTERNLDVGASFPAAIVSLESSRTSSDNLAKSYCSVLKKSRADHGDVLTIGPDRDLFKSFCLTYGLDGSCQAAKNNCLEGDGAGKVDAATHDQPPSTGFLVTVSVPPPASDGESTTDSEDWQSPAQQRSSEDLDGDDWNDLQLLNTDDERYRAVRKLWKNVGIPDLNLNLSCQNYRRREWHSISEPDSGGRESQDSRKRRNKSLLGDRLGPKPSKRPRVDGAATESYSCSRVFYFRRSSLGMTYDIEKKTLVVEYENAIHSMSLRHRDECDRNRQRMNEGWHDCEDWGAIKYRHHMEISDADKVFAQRLRNLDNKYDTDVRKLMESREEILAIQAFYCGLCDNDRPADFDTVDLLDDNQIHDMEETEAMYRFYDTYYKGGKFRPCAAADSN